MNRYSNLASRVQPRQTPGLTLEDVALAYLAQTELDRFQGTVLNVTGAAKTGKITAKWVNKAPEGTHLSIPAAVKADGNTFEVGASYQNTGTMSFVGGIEVVVTKPDGSQVTPAIDWANISAGQTLSKEYNIAKVDQTGTWTIVMRFLAQ
jgi:hypothetical protein